MNNKVQVEAGFDGGRVQVSIDPPGPTVTRAEPDGAANGRQLVAAALASAVGSAINRAKKLLAVVQEADDYQTEHRERLALIDRRVMEASGLLFGHNLDDRLAALAREREEAAEKNSEVRRRRSTALAELQSIRDAVVNDGPRAVANIVTQRMKSATAEREQTAAKLVAVMADLLAQLIRLDKELAVLGRVKAGHAVQDHLENVLPQAFADDGLAPLVSDSDRREVRQRRRQRERVEELLTLTTTRYSPPRPGEPEEDE